MQYYIYFELVNRSTYLIDFKTKRVFGPHYIFVIGNQLLTEKTNRNQIELEPISGISPVLGS